MSREDFLLRRAALKRDAILTAARARFAADGLDGASVERIANDAQVSTATLYRQFPSKLALFEATLRDGLATFEAALDASRGAGPRERLIELAHAYAKVLDDPLNAGMVRAAFAAAPATPQVAEIFYAQVKTVVAGAFHAAVAEAAQAKLIAPAPKADPARPGGRLMGMIEHPILWRRMLSNEAGERTPAEIADAALEAFFKAHAI